MRLKEVLLLLFSMVSLFLSAYFLPQMTDTLTLFLGFTLFEVSKFYGVFAFPIFCFALLIFYWLYKHFRILKVNFESVRDILLSFFIFMMLIAIYYQVIIVLWNTMINYRTSHLVAPLFSIGFYVVSLLLSRLREKENVGFITPWTSRSEEVWKKTHVAGSKFFKVLTLVCFGWVFFPDFFALFVFFPFLLLVVGLYIYSYLEYKRKAV